MKSDHSRADEINKLILDIASGNFGAKIDYSRELDEWDSVGLSVQLLAEELEYTTIRRDQLQMIYNGIVDMLFILNEDRSIRQINGISITKLGYNEKELLGKNVFEIFENIDSELIHKIINEIFEKGYSFIDELSIRCRNNDLIPASCSFSLLKDKNDEIEGLIIIAKDISQIKQYQQALIKRNMELDQMFYRMSHDFKSPLTNISGFSKLAMSEFKENPTMFRYFDMILESVHKLENILVKIREIRDTTIKQPEQIYSTDINLGLLIDEEYRNFLKRFSVEEKAFNLKMNVENDVPITSSQAYLIKIFRNLFDLSYYLKKKDEDMQIIIFLKFEDDAFYITYIDNSRGVDPEVHNEAFNMFVKPSVNYESTGLELYTIKEITTKLNGKIELLRSSVQGLNCQLTFPIIISNNIY